MTDYINVLNQIRKSNLVDEDEIILLAQNSLNFTYLMFGAIGGAIAQSKVKKYVMSVSNRGIKLFILDKNGQYSNTMAKLDAEKITKLSTGMGSITVTCDGEKYKLMTSKKMFKIDQRSEYELAMNILKEMAKSIKKK